MRVVLCNCSVSEAASLARTLVDERLAACVNIVPGVQSVYRWQGDVQVDPESTLLIKTTETRLAAMSERLRALHSYELPEIVVLAVDAESSDSRYLAWVNSAVEATA